jgi:hypothetical protein
MNTDLLELYSDYLLSSFGYTTATGLSKMTGGAVSHDKITRFLSEQELDSPKLWRLVKPLVRESEDKGSGVLIIDDTIEEKPYTDESELVCWHYDHSKRRNVKGINLLSTLYQVGDASIPVAFELVKKTEWVFNEKKKKGQRKSPQTKNELYRRMLKACIRNRIPLCAERCLVRLFGEYALHKGGSGKRVHHAAKKPTARLLSRSKRKSEESTSKLPLSN